MAPHKQRYQSYQSRQRLQSDTETALNKPPPRYVLEGYVLDHPNQGVLFRFSRKGKDIYVKIPDHEEGLKPTITADPEDIRVYRNEIIDMSSSRMKVLERLRPGDYITGRDSEIEYSPSGAIMMKNPPESSTITPEKIGHRPGFWRTEWQELRLSVTDSSQHFGYVRKNDLEDGLRHVNRVLVYWHAGNERVEVCLIDGEEVDVEHR